ncbi:nitrogenase-stabilizing/protective protein NifW [Vibrio salinus]|uniref:nitrogenase-stabilizing/protective protein NifW n=1 Tax=Vibrio salinus TaxID=2899784 RepID=UPI001E3AD531|nr:nitrogenase-stabilizing/protective protein NifW [Vibrio salinus]MCE0495426.1 nitrogenase-stabilizing/protective protein NifW [Vibrio salinus]
MDVTLSGDFMADIEALSTAEDFLDYFKIPYDPKLVQIKRVQLLRMYQKLLPEESGPPQYERYKQALCTAYRQISLGRELAFEAGGCNGCTECSD